MAGKRQPRSNPSRLQMLLGLWRPDEDAMGYQTYALCAAICEELRPVKVDELIANLWPGSDVSEEERVFALSVFKWWQAKQKRGSSEPPRAA